MHSVGIEKISFYTPPFYLNLSTLAEQRGQDPEKFRRGLGQEKMSQPAPDEDIITMAVKAADVILSETDKASIETILFATESGVDQSKSAGLYAHQLLQMPETCRIVEVKQACYAATAALQLAAGMIAWRPGKKVLILASDVARYDLDSPGEATQGAGAVALLVSHDPKIAELEWGCGLHSEGIHDFWRPNHRSTPLVDGKFSTKAYLNSLKFSWQGYFTETQRALTDHQWLCYHTPFCGMARKAHRELLHIHDLAPDTIELAPTLAYNREIGNAYTASLYLSLISLLETTEVDLSGQRVGCFSYGSGATGEFFSLKIQPGYQTHLPTAYHRKMLSDRQALDFATYQDWHEQGTARSEEDFVTPELTAGYPRFTGVTGQARCYK